MFLSSILLIDLSPCLLYHAPPFPGFLSIQSCPLQSFSSKTFIQLGLGIIAIAQHFVPEPFGVTFIECGHNFGAAWSRYGDEDAFYFERKYRNPPRPGFEDVRTRCHRLIEDEVEQGLQRDSQ